MHVGQRCGVEGWWIFQWFWNSLLARVKVPSYPGVPEEGYTAECGLCVWDRALPLCMCAFSEGCSFPPKCNYLIGRQHLHIYRQPQSLGISWRWLTASLLSLVRGSFSHLRGILSVQKWANTVWHVTSWYKSLYERHPVVVLAHWGPVAEVILGGPPFSVLNVNEISNIDTNRDVVRWEKCQQN